MDNFDFLPLRWAEINGFCCFQRQTFFFPLVLLQSARKRLPTYLQYCWNRPNHLSILNGVSKLLIFSIGSLVFHHSPIKSLAYVRQYFYINCVYHAMKTWHFMLENGDFERETRLKNLRWIEDLIDNNSRIIISKNHFIV